MTIVLVALAVTAAWVALRLLTPDWVFYLVAASYCTGATIFCVVLGPYWGAVFNGISAVIWWWMLWRNLPRGRRKRAAKLIGAKARAIRARLVAAMPKPSAVPVPA